MDEHEVSRFGHVDLEDMPDDLRARVGAVAEKSGFVPNVFRALARRPAELRAFLDYHDALMERSDGLSKAERELVVVATSGANHCEYCVVAHGAILRVRARDPQIADRVATNPWAAPLPPRERAIVDEVVEPGRKAVSEPERGGGGLRLSPWNLLLLVPFLMLVTPWINHDQPRLFGMPFFYWIQFAFVPVGVVAVAIVYVKTLDRGPAAPGEPIDVDRLDEGTADEEAVR